MAIVTTVEKISDLEEGKDYTITQVEGSLLGTFTFVKPDGLPNDESLFFDNVNKDGMGHTAFFEDFDNYIYKAV